MNLPLHDFAQNQIWCAIIMLAAELTAWMQLLAPHQPRRPPVGNETAPATAVTVPAALARTGRRVLLHLAAKAPWAQLVADALQRLRIIAVPG